MSRPHIDHIPLPEGDDFTKLVGQRPMDSFIDMVAVTDHVQTGLATPQEDAITIAFYAFGESLRVLDNANLEDRHSMTDIVAHMLRALIAANVDADDHRRPGCWQPIFNARELKKHDVAPIRALRAELHVLLGYELPVALAANWKEKGHFPERDSPHGHDVMALATYLAQPLGKILRAITSKLAYFFPDGVASLPAQKVASRQLKHNIDDAWRRATALYSTSSQPSYKGALTELNARVTHDVQLALGHDHGRLPSDHQL